jgi:hypothetical protein
MAATSCHPNIGRHLNVSRASGGVNAHCEKMKWNRGVNRRGVETATILFIAVCLLFTFNAEK